MKIFGILFAALIPLLGAPAAHAASTQHDCSKSNVPYCSQVNVCAAEGETWTKGSTVSKGTGSSSCGMGYSRYSVYDPSTQRRNAGCYKVSACSSGRICQEIDSTGNSSYYCVMLSGGQAPTQESGTSGTTGGGFTITTGILGGTTGGTTGFSSGGALDCSGMCCCSACVNGSCTLGQMTSSGCSCDGMGGL